MPPSHSCNFLPGYTVMDHAHFVSRYPGSFYQIVAGGVAYSDHTVGDPGRVPVDPQVLKLFQPACHPAELTSVAGHELSVGTVHRGHQGMTAGVPGGPAGKDVCPGPVSMDDVRVHMLQQSPGDTGHLHRQQGILPHPVAEAGNGDGVYAGPLQRLDHRPRGHGEHLDLVPPLLEFPGEGQYVLRHAALPGVGDNVDDLHMASL